MEFKDLVRTRRLELGMTMEELAKRVSVSTPTIQRYESGEIKNIRRDKVQRLSDALQCSPAYLMGWEDDDSDFTLSLNDILKLCKQKNTDMKTLIKTISISDLFEYKVDEYWSKLNDLGKEKAVENLKDLTLIQKYCKDTPDYLQVVAAHAKPGATDEEIQHDNDIMNNDELWK